ncbi:MAG: GNAT family N-acetyltransferase [Armatimonadetes bacterium]|nr:GNAT family N-acetyltransferase [Armatimonadota bacterium]
MAIKIAEESATALPDYGRVPIAFLVRSRFRVDVVHHGLGGLRLVEEHVDPYLKDYDGEGEGPSHWQGRWDIAHWGVLSAFEGSKRVGGAVIAWRTPGVTMLKGRDDLATLWDLRVHPDNRGAGVGHRLFARALAWARDRECRLFQVETQNINVPACRFYTRQGCELGAINRHAYGEASDEAQLLWYKGL